MVEKKFPLTKEQLKEIVKKYPTPFNIYDERGIRQAARRMLKAFSILPQFKEFYAVKALPNPYILEILKEEGLGTDCSSYPELLLSKAVGITGEDVMFSSNETPDNEFLAAAKLGAVINFDDITHVDIAANVLGGKLPELISFRYNPGPLKKGNVIIGKPEEAKYGLTREQIFEGYKKASALGAKRFGLHTMVASNELDSSYFVETAKILFELVLEVYQKTGIRIEMVNIGGGMGIPYKPEETPVDFDFVARGVKELYDQIIEKNNLGPVKICSECGRIITGPYGYLVSTAIREKHTYRDYIGLDSSMADFMRPGVYGSWQYMSVVGKEGKSPDMVYDVVGSLCENCDKFAVQRQLPKIDMGDFVVLHDTGAHGRAMGFNYNGKLRSGEHLLKEDGSIVEIRRKETVSDYFSTLDYPGLKDIEL